MKTMSTYSLYLTELDQLTYLSQLTHLTGLTDLTTPEDLTHLNQSNKPDKTTSPTPLYCREKGGDWQPISAEHLSAQALTLDVVLSARFVTVLSLQPPKNYRKYGQAFLLNFAEPNIAQPIERVELFPLQQHQDRLSVAIIDKQLWQTLSAQVAAHGWQLGKVCIDALCLPLREQQASLLALSQQQVLWRHANDAIFSGDLALLEQTQTYQDNPADNAQWLTPQQATDNAAPAQEAAIKQLLTWAQTAQHNLHPPVASHQSGRQIAGIAVTAGLALLLWTANLTLSNRHQQQLADNYYRESVALFHSVLPQYQKIPSRTYLKQQLARVLDNQPVAPAYWRDWLLAVAQTLNTETTQVLSIDYYSQPPHMTLVVESANQDALQALNNRLAQTLSVQLTQSEQQTNGLRATLEVTP